MGRGEPHYTSNPDRWNFTIAGAALSRVWPRRQGCDRLDVFRLPRKSKRIVRAQRGLRPARSHRRKDLGLYRLYTKIAEYYSCVTRFRIKVIGLPSVTHSSRVRWGVACTGRENSLLTGREGVWIVAWNGSAAARMSESQITTQRDGHGSWWLGLLGGQRPDTAQRR